MKTEEKRKALKEIRSLAKAGDTEETFSRLRLFADPSDDFTLQAGYGRTLKSLPSDALDLRPVRVALLSSSTLEHFLDVLRFWLVMEGLDPEFYLAPFDTISQTALDPSSDLYSFSPDVVWLFSSHRDVNLRSEPGESEQSALQAVRDSVREFQALWEAIHAKSSCSIIQNNADLPAERVFGNFEGLTPRGRANLLQRFNLELASAASTDVAVFDLEHVSSLYGKQRWADPRYWFHSKHAFSLDASGLVAFHGAKLIGAIRGTAKKCIVLDLDNTLWGGVVGDDGLEGIRLGSGAEGEAFVAFQEYMKSLKERGIILTVCSKNEEATAKEPFLHHPDMRLSLDDISVFVANWDDKPGNIREIAGILDIGLDSLVFVDDDAMQRDMVRTTLPMITVPEMPSDPADYVAAIDRLRLFETISFSDEDKGRTRMYRDNIVRREQRQNFGNLSDYLESLDMEAVVGGIDDFHLGRMAQLINKSNQFHLTGTRLTESEIESLNETPDHIVRYFTLKDKFGDNGLISVIILRREHDSLVADTWVMSCRVLSRGMEEFICREMLSIGRAEGCRRIVGHYIPSKKNQLVTGLYERLKFTKTGEEDGGATWWELIIGDSNPEYDIHIRRTETEGLEVKSSDGCD